MTLKELREGYNLTQKQVSIILGIPERTYYKYEADEKYGNNLKREALKEEIYKSFKITEI